MTNRKINKPGKIGRPGKPGVEEMFDKSADYTEEYTDIVRFPLRLHVDAIKFEAPPTIDVVRSSYELIIQPHELQKLYDKIGEMIAHDPYKEQSVTVVGRLTQ
jgi:hypothetical protein